MLQEDYEKIEVDYSGLDRARDASRELTRRVFSWLRPDGFPERERELREHEWFRDLVQVGASETGPAEGEAVPGRAAGGY